MIPVAPIQIATSETGKHNVSVYRVLSPAPWILELASEIARVVKGMLTVLEALLARVGSIDM